MKQLSRLTFLGTGTSIGVPVIGCDCPVCQSTLVENKRTRSSILLEVGNVNVLVDTGPDLHQQAIREKIKRIDAVIYTHAHMDHVVGFDELRAFCWHRNDPLPLYANEESMRTIQHMFSWAFSSGNTYRGYVRPDPIVMTQPFLLGELLVTPFPVIHGKMETSGLLFEHPSMGKIVYMPDVKSIPDSSLLLIEHCDVLIIDTLRIKEHPTHMNLEETLAAVKKINPKKTYLTHISHELDHTYLLETLPPNILPAFDGLTLDF